jgi:meso-butanediol dehydrogenase/(S,S)-butanediol dehydrogenase/diacetyl reductase
MDRLAGKLVVVTGGSRGLGPRIGARCANEGANVALLARDSRQLQTVAAAIGPAASAYATDVARPESVRAAFAAIGARYGRVDVLVNNAAIGAPHTIEEMTDDDLAGQLATNVAGPITCIRAALPLLRAAGGGDVINVSTVAVANPFPTMWLYSATKAALEAASAGLAEELAPDGVRVSVLRVGSIADSSFQERWPAERKERAEQLARGTGRERFAGAGRTDPDLLAEWVVRIATMPPEARVGVLEIRPC